MDLTAYDMKCVEMALIRIAIFVGGHEAISEFGHNFC